MLAIENNQVDIVEALLNARDSSNKRKIDLTLKNDKGQTPREYAIEHGSRQIFELIF